MNCLLLFYSNYRLFGLERKEEYSMKEKKFKGLALTLLAVSQLILALDYTIIFVGLPSIAVELGFSANSLQWVVSAFSLVYGGFLLIGGRLSDLLGRRGCLL